MLSDHCPVLSVCLSCLSVMLVYCSQTVRWIKMKLGMEVGLGSGHIVLDGDLAPRPPPKGPCLLWPNGWMDQDATWYGVRSRPRRHYVKWGPSSPKKRGTSPIFGPCLLWPNGCPSQLHLSSCSCFRSHCKPPLSLSLSIVNLYNT